MKRKSPDKPSPSPQNGRGPHDDGGGKVLAFRNTQRELGYLPAADKHYNSEAWRDRHKELVLSKWLRLGDPAVGLSEVAEMRELERAFEREGPPQVWPSFEAHIELAQSARKKFQGVVEGLDLVIGEMGRRQALRGLRTHQQQQQQQQQHQQQQGALETPHHQSSRLAQLPDEILVHMGVRDLDPRAIAALACTCRRFSNLLLDGDMWKLKLCQYVGPDETWGVAGGTSGRLKRVWLVLRDVSLAQLFPDDEAGVYRELCLRFWYTNHSELCGLCRLHKKPTRTGGTTWRYDDPLLLIAKITTHKTRWHDEVVAQACDHCQSSWLITMAGIKVANLVAGTHFSRNSDLAESMGLRPLVLWPIRGVLRHTITEKRYFIEDVLVSARKRTSAFTPRFVDPSPGRILPKFETKTGSTSGVAYFTGRVPSQRRSRWIARAKLAQLRRPAKRMREQIADAMDFIVEGHDPGLSAVTPAELEAMYPRNGAGGQRRGGEVGGFVGARH